MRTISCPDGKVALSAGIRPGVPAESYSDALVVYWSFPLNETTWQFYFLPFYAMTVEMNIVCAARDE